MASTPVEITANLLGVVDATDVAANISAQAHARNVLFEVRENVENFPAFDEDLDNRVAALAYTLLHIGCTAAENNRKAEAIDSLTRAATLLQYSYTFDRTSNEYVAFQLLIAALAYYVAGQYSRAFVVLRSVQQATPATRIIAAFLRKQFTPMIAALNAVLLAQAFRDDEIAKGESDESDASIDRVLTTFVAKGMAHLAEFVFSGQRDLIAAARSWFSDGAEAARLAEEVRWWWLFRLLILATDDLNAASPWTILPLLYAKTSPGLTTYLQLLPFLRPRVAELWRSQREALDMVANLNNRGAAISLRTSAGKTRLAEIAAVAALTSDTSTKVLYVAPFRSLALEIERSFRRTLEPLGFQVSHLYGGSRAGALDTELLEDANMIIATPEKLRALIRSSSEWADRVRLIIIDEGHLLGLDERYVRNELFIDHLRAMSGRTGARILLLSAVLPNVEDIAQWITGDRANVGTSDWKPSGERHGLLLWDGHRVRLEWRGNYDSFNPSFVVAAKRPGSKTKKKFPSSKREAIAATAIRLSVTGPVLIFAGLAVSIPGYAEAVLAAQGLDADDFEWPNHEWSIFKATCEEYFDAEAVEVRAAQKGIICHHARLPGEVRLAVEHLMAAKAPRVVIATSTLAQGVNFGFTSVIMANVWVNKRTIPVRDFWNIAGRAGRAFVDTEGKILFAVDETEVAWKVRRNKALAAKYFDARNVEQVDSGLLKLLQLVKDIADDSHVTFEKLLEMAAENDIGGSGRVEHLDGLFDLIDDELLALYEEITTAEQSDAATTVDKLLATSLAAIQATRPNATLTAEQVLSLLRARITRALRQFNQPEDIRSAVCSGLPMRASMVLKEHAAEIESLLSRYVAEERPRTILIEIVKYFESLSHKLPNICREIPAGTELDLVRDDWLLGISLRIMAEKTARARAITTDYYGYGLPWIIHAAGQQLRSSSADELAAELDKVALGIEFGLPSPSAAKVYLSGIRSRSAAAQIASRLRNLEEASLREIRLFLTTEEARTRLKPLIDDLAQRWLDILDSEERATRPIAHSISDFTLAVPANIETLHVRETSGTHHICATDYSFAYATQSTNELPFRLIANDPRYVFERRENSQEVWTCVIRDPFLATALKRPPISIAF